MDNTVEGYNDNAIVKTVYDPCPAGFKVPASNAFSGFSTTGNNTNTPSQFNVSGGWENGWNFNNKITAPDATIYFPAANYRFQFSGVLYLPGNGVYCSAIPALVGATAICHMGFDQTTYMYPFVDGALTSSAGYSIRPVAE